MKSMKTKAFFKAAAIAVTIATISGIPATPLISTASAAITIDGKQDAKAVKIIEASIEALGGREKMEELKYMHQTGTISIPAMGLKGTIETSIASPDKLRLVIDLPMMGKTTQGLNDGIVWSSDAINGPQILPEEEAKDLIDQSDLLFPLKFLETYPTIEYVEETEFDGQAVHKLRLVDQNEKESTGYYSIESGHQIGLEAIVDSPMGKILTITTLSEYKEIGGQIQPTKILQKIGPTEVLVNITSADSSAIDDSVFEIPAAVSALIEATAAKEKASP